MFLTQKFIKEFFFNASFAPANTQIYVVRSAGYEDDYPYCS